MFTSEQLDALQAAAEAATPGTWEAEADDGEGTTVVNAGSALTTWTEYEGGIKIGSPARSWRTTDRILERDDLYDEDFDQADADATFIAAANPAVVLELVAAHRAALSRIARVEALHESGPVHIVASDGATISRLTCLHCSQVQSGEIVQPGDAYVWPCPTVRTLTEGEPSE